MIDTQNKMLIAHLKMGGSVTGLSALRMFGIGHLPRRIADVQKILGKRIDREWVNVRSRFGKKRVYKYFLKK